MKRPTSENKGNTEYINELNKYIDYLEYKFNVLDYDLKDKIQPAIYEKRIIDYLNTKTGKNFRLRTKTTRNLIKARMNEGFDVEDFFKVIDNKCKGWLNDPDMNIYLRPETLFGNKFEGYLNEKSKVESIWKTLK